MPWSQNYDPLGQVFLSTAVAALPLVALLGLLATGRVKAHLAAVIGLAVAILVAIFALGMPAGLAIRSAIFGSAYGLFPIGWIILNVIFLYHLVHERGLFDVLQQSIVLVTTDRRLQLLLIAFSFGAFFEGAAGFGTPVAVTGAILIGLGFPPLEASALSLIANTAPVAFGALGTPVIALQGVTGLDLRALSAMVGRQLPVFSVIVPLWLVWAYAGFKGMVEVLPAVLVAGVSFAVPQFLVSNYHGPWLVDVVSAACSIAALVIFLRFWSPARNAGSIADAQVKISSPSPVRGGDKGEVPGRERGQGRGTGGQGRGLKAGGVNPFLPWIILSVLVFLWGLPTIKNLLNGISSPKISISGLDQAVLRVPPVVAQPVGEAAVFTFNWLSATGTAILLAAVIVGALLRYSPLEMARVYGRTLGVVRYSLLTIAAMMALGYTTRYSGMDAILGLAFARTGFLYPFFGTLLGWLGVALTGSDTSSNVLFGSLQKITAQQIGVSPTLMAAANSSGGVMGKMIDAQSIVVASTATRWFGHEGRILRYVFFHSLALAALVGIWVFLQAYVAPFSSMVVR